MKKILTAIFAIAFLSAPAGALGGQTVNIRSDISGFVYGNSTTTDLSDQGNSNDTDPSRNIVNTNGYNISKEVYGGKYRTSNDAVNRNTVNISSGDISGRVSGGYAKSGEASENTVNISNGKFGGRVNGGYSTQTTANNSVNILDGEFGSVYGGSSTSGEASLNTVRISGGSFDGDIYGGNTYSGEAAGNTVYISGGVFNGKSICGGYSNSGQTVGNMVYISGSPNLGGTSLFGGWTEKNSDLSTNNTLELHSQVTVKEMRYFQYLNFYLPAMYDKNSAMLTVSVAAHIGGAVVGIGIGGDSSPLRAGETIKLIGVTDGGVLIGEPLNNGDKVVVRHGATLKYECVIGMDMENDVLFATVAAGGSENTGDSDDAGSSGDTGGSDDAGSSGGTGGSGDSGDIGGSGNSGGATVTNMAKALSEGSSANIAAINSGGDLISGAGVMPRGSSSEAGSQSFGATSFGKSRYKTGSYVDSDTLSVLAGVRLAEIKLGRAALSRGVFAEAGMSSYDTFNYFADEPAVRGSGESNYFGGGLALRADYGGNGRGWFYNDASIRFGRAHNSFACDDGILVSYKTDAPYYGGHIGLGYVRELKNGASLDIGTKLLWTRLEGDSVTLRTKDPITFARSDSLRARVGARYDAERFYAGLAYEYEFAGDADATARGFSIPAPSLKGGTGICELGFTLGKKNAPFNADVNISAFTGKRAGFAAGINLNWKF